MKNILAILCLSMLVLAACEETGPNIVLEDAVVLIDTTYVNPTPETPQTKVVVMEEFTGVKCTACPKGHEKAAELKTTWGSQFLFISYHSDVLDDPYPFSPLDMGSEEADAIELFLGSVLGKPSAAIDRKLFQGETELLHLTQKWSNFVQIQATGPNTPINLHLTADFNAANEELVVTATVHYTSNVVDENKLSILLIENGIVAPQLNDGIIDTFYVHDEVFRAFVTNPKGDLIDPPDKVPGREVVKAYLFDDFGSDWNLSNMEVIAFIHKNDVDKEIYHGTHADF